MREGCRCRSGTALEATTRASGGILERSSFFLSPADLVWGACHWYGRSLPDIEVDLARKGNWTHSLLGVGYK